MYPNAPEKSQIKTNEDKDRSTVKCLSSGWHIHWFTETLKRSFTEFVWGLAPRSWLGQNISYTDTLDFVTFIFRCLKFVVFSPLSCVPCLRREAGDVWCLPPPRNLRAVIWFHSTISSLVLLLSPVILSVLSFSLPADPFFSTVSRKFLIIFR